MRLPEDTVITRRTFENEICGEYATVKAIFGGRGRLTAAQILNNKTGKKYSWMRYLFTESEILWTGVIQGVEEGRYRNRTFEHHIVDGRLHRDDGPAIIEMTSDGWSFERWHYHGIIHRVGGPAYSAPNEDIWYLNGNRTRADGPAIIRYRYGARYKRIRPFQHTYLGHPEKGGVYELDDDGNELPQARSSIFDDENPF